jgi:hypothetical protein
MDEPRPLTEPATSPTWDFIGEGEFPAELDRPNWGAGLFALFWVWIYKVRGWRLALTALFIVPLVIENAVLLFIDPQTTFQTTVVVLGLVTDLAYLVARVYFGLNANRIIWELQRERREAAGGDPAKPIPAWRYAKSTRFWTRLGLAIVALSCVAEVALLVFRPESRSGALATWPIGAVVLIATFVIDRWRRRRKRAS